MGGGGSYHAGMGGAAVGRRLSSCGGDYSARSTPAGGGLWTSMKRKCLFSYLLFLYIWSTFA